MTAVYALPVPAPEAADSLLETLPPPRREKAAALRHPQAKARSVAAGLLLKTLLGSKAEQLAAGQNGKPTVPGIQLNLSHSGAWAVCALSDGPTGVDVERIKAHDAVLWKRVFTPAELAHLSTPADHCRLWTAKESFLKYLGAGLAISPRRVEVRFPTLTLDGAPQKAYLHQYPLEGYAVTVCAQTPDFAPEVTILPLPV